jgi:hypothetical protein
MQQQLHAAEDSQGHVLAFFCKVDIHRRGINLIDDKILLLPTAQTATCMGRQQRVWSARFLLY